MIKSIRAQESGSMVVAIIATLAIALILFVFAVFSAFFSIKKDVDLKALEYSYDYQTQKSLLNLMLIKDDSFMVSDLIRYSKINQSIMKQTEDLVKNILEKSFHNSMFSTTNGITIGKLYKGYTIQIPDFGEPITIYLALNE